MLVSHLVSPHIGLWGDVDEPCEPRAGSLDLGQVTLCGGDDTQPGSVSLAGDLYRRDAAVRKVSLKVMFSLLTAAPLVDDARVTDDAFKAVAHPPLVIPQVLITDQIDHAASVLRNADGPNLVLSSPNSMT
jgi:hypothetical protein